MSLVRNTFFRSLSHAILVFVLLLIFYTATAKDNLAKELASPLEVKFIGGNNDAFFSMLNI